MRPAKLWVVVGATGTGKTRFSLRLAEHVSAHIVNADAMQFYRGMDIGTAKITTPEMRGIPHHLFDVLDVTEEATVAWYQPLARKLITGLLAQGTDVILVGGSGLYVSSVIYDFEFPPRDEELRDRLQTTYTELGVDPLLKQLQQLAPRAATTVDKNNPRRVIRALELALLGAEAPTELPRKPKLWHENTSIIGVATERTILVERLNARVEEMWRQGIVAEVQNLLPLGLESGPTAARAIGYQQAIEQLQGTLTEQEAIEATQLLTRKYARRQVSWFKRYENINWVDGECDVASLR